MRSKSSALMVCVSVGLLSLTLAKTCAEETFDAQTPVETLRAAAKSGNPSAQRRLANRLLDGNAHSPQILRILQDEKERLRKKYSSGTVGFGEDPEKEMNDEFQKFVLKLSAGETKEALDLLEAAIAKNDGGSMADLGYLYFEDKRVPQNYKRSIELWRKGAELGNYVCLSNLGMCYARGKGVTKDVKEAVKWYEKSCEKGYFRACAVLAAIMTDGGSDGKDDGYSKNPQRAYVLGRALQLASERGSDAYQWGGQSVAKARQHLEPEQLIAAETEAEKEAERLKAASGVKAGAGKPSVDLKNPGAISKEQWKTALGRINPVFAQGGVIQMRKDNFIEIFGEPQKTQTVGDSVYWYYQCSDGFIQLTLDKGNLLGGILAGKANDY